MFDQEWANRWSDQAEWTNRLLKAVIHCFIRTDEIVEQSYFQYAIYAISSLMIMDEPGIWSSGSNGRSFQIPPQGCLPLQSIMITVPHACSWALLGYVNLDWILWVATLSYWQASQNGAVAVLAMSVLIPVNLFWKKVHSDVRSCTRQWSVSLATSMKTNSM